METHGPACTGRAVSRSVACKPDNLGRTAADIEEQKVGRAVGSASEPQPVAASRCFRLAIDDLKPKSRMFGDPCYKFFAIRSRTTGLGRDETRPGHAPAVHLVAADVERIERTSPSRHRESRPVTQAGPLQAARSSKKRRRSRRLSAPSGMPASGGLRDQKATVVRAEIERGVDVMRRALVLNIAAGGS